MNLFAIKKIFTSRYHAQANLVERSHRTLHSFIRSYINRDKNNCCDILKYATFAYNNTVNSITGQTPHFFAHGFNLQIPTQLTKNKPNYNYDDFAEITRNNIVEALKLAKEKIHAQKLKNKKYYDRKTYEQEIHVGDMVLYKSPVRDHKFQNVYEGPYEVVDASDSYIEILKKNKRIKVHKNHVKKAKANHDINYLHQ